MHSVSAPLRAILPNGAWRLDPDHSLLGFSVEKLGYGTVRGRFREVAATVTVTSEETIATGSIRAGSVDTGDERRDAHLRGDGFFAVLEHPEISFEMSDIEQVGHLWQIAADVTIRNSTRVVEMVVDIGENSDAERRRLMICGQLERYAFGLRWNRATEATGAVAPVVRFAFDLALERAAT
jgi:polyisoprenoid-binding protein YceI